MIKNSQSGFSLVELLLVVTIIGIIAAMGVPSLQKGIRAADNGAAFATLRTMSVSQVNYYSQNGRFARLSELNSIHGNSLGTSGCSGNCLQRGRFTFEMVSLTPTDPELKQGYTILANGSGGAAGTNYQFRVTQTGEIIQLAP